MRELTNSAHSIIPGARKKPRGPRGGGITKHSKKGKGATKRSTLRRALLFSGTAEGTGTVNGTGKRIKTCLPTEREDTRTDEQKAAVLSWVRLYHAPRSLLLTHTALSPQSKVTLLATHTGAQWQAATRQAGQLPASCTGAHQHPVRVAARLMRWAPLTRNGAHYHPLQWTPRTPATRTRARHGPLQAAARWMRLTP
jgi:hypothetical protein